MKIELKHIKIVEAFSEETTAFTADLFINGKCVGYAKNDGHGGMTDVYSNDGSNGSNGQLIAEAENWAKEQPNYNKNGFTDIPMTLDFYIDLLIDDYMKAKDEAKMKKAQLKELQWGVPNSSTYWRTSWKGLTLAQLAAKPNGLAVLQSRIDYIKREFKGNEVFLNAEYLKSIGCNI